MNKFHLYMGFVLLQIQISQGISRYCQEAVDNAESVSSCPTSKKEWDIAARKKNCSKIASHQKCSSVEKFQYHCVLNGYRNETLEVCAPSRVIFGYCVEFNLLGGVIQDQHSSPCNDTFPKCDKYYNSSTAYKWEINSKYPIPKLTINPDCYQLVSVSGHTNSSTTMKYDVTSTTTYESLSGEIQTVVWIVGIVSGIIVTLVCISVIIHVKRSMMEPRIILYSP